MNKGDACFMSESCTHNCSSCSACLLYTSTDFFLWTGWVPMSDSLPVQLVLMLVGLVIMFIGA